MTRSHFTIHRDRGDILAECFAAILAWTDENKTIPTGNLGRAPMEMAGKSEAIELHNQIIYQEVSHE